MKPYRFSLENVLEWRAEKEKVISEKLIKKTNQIEEKSAEIEGLVQEYEKIKNDARTFKNTSELIRMQQYRQSLADSIEKERGSLSRLNNEREEIMKDLVKARQDKSAIEKLKEKDHEDYKEKLRMFEQKFLDEIATLRHTRKEG
ncbi:MAG TPA: flagellar export protein FliJ [Gudongella oleilytica]|nr:flagellar export protein FliJ [Gudongella oleilytica]